MSRVVGMDLGTTNSVVAFTDPTGVTTSLAGTDGERILPSVVHFQDGGVTVVGARAKQYAVVEPDRVAMLFKRGMGTNAFLASGDPLVVDGKTWTPEELSSLVLRRLKQFAEEHFREPVSRAVITVPAYFGEPERAATRDAGELAGLEVLRILNEPTAAAIAHGFDTQTAAGHLLVFDLGGGTFDVTVMATGDRGEMTVLATGGDRRLGGADFDAAILQQMIDAVRREAGVDLYDDAYALQDAKAKAEEIKKELSTAYSATRPLTAGGRPVMFTIDRRQFEGLIAERLRDVRDTIENTIAESGIARERLTSVLMVGGSSRIPAFQEMVRDISGRDPVFSRNLDEDVARGAAIYAAKLSGDADPRSELARMPVPVDAASHGLGVTLMKDDRSGLYNEILIAAGTALPARAETVIVTANNGQHAVDIDLNEGDDTELDYVRQLGSSTGEFAQPVPAGYGVRLTMSYTPDQLVTVQAFDHQTGQHLCDLIVPREGRMSAAEQQEAQAFLKQLEVR